MKDKEIIIPARKGKGGICFGPYALTESICGMPEKRKAKMKKPIFRKEAKEKVRCFIKANSLQAEYFRMLEKSVPVESVTYEFGDKMGRIKVVAVIDGKKREFDFDEVIVKGEKK